MASGNSPSSLIASKESSLPSSSSLPSTSSSQSPTSPIVTQPQTPCPPRVAMKTDDLISPQPINIFGQVTDFLDRHLQALRICVALLGVTGIVIIGRSIRVMKTFRAVSDIPEEFIRKQMTLRGKVRGHQDHHLLVEHLPIIRGMKGMKKGQRDSLLPVCLAGVHVSEGGLTHLVNMTPVDSLIRFRLLAVNEAQQLECIVTRRKNFASSLMVNESLVRQGFARVKPAHPSVALHPTTVRLIQRLSKAELHAEKKAKGIWAKPPLRERMNERAQEVKDGLKERLVSAMTPFTVGINAIKAAGARVGAIIRWSKKSSKNG
ncbi:protein C3orf33-like [Strongylocentrotus purpuratus]|uniref:Uncharacterized protein n=1 Tax=Strongylocentrotus purpuratus TaxID=7668 RepID=A0A7M7P1Y2_STRPU|nr:protein C3orf33-like [Strongylocentrotus purpuratus]